MADLTEAQIAIGNGAPATEPTIYVACHQCDDCGHIGINDEAAPEDGKCRRCGWRGPYPSDDTCPDCHADSCIESVCPQCEGCYVLLVEDHIPAVPDGVMASDGWSSEQPNADGRWLWREAGKEHREVELVLCSGGAEVADHEGKPDGSAQSYWMRTRTDQKNMPGLWKRAPGVPPSFNDQQGQPR